MKMARNKEKKEKKKLGKGARIFLVILFIILLLAGGVAFAYFFCTVETVEVEGTDLYTDQEITDYLLDDPYCSNAVYAVVLNFLCPKNKAEFIDHFEVTMTGLNSLKIEAFEKPILGYVTNDYTEFVYFNYDGQIVEISPSYIDGYMRVEGVTYENPVVGDSLSVSADNVGFLTNLIKLLEKNELMPNIISYDEYGYVTLKYDEFDICLGSSSYSEEKIDRLKYILPEIEGMSGTLHLENFTPDNTDIVFEKSEELEE